MLISSAKNSCGGMLERREDEEEISRTQRSSPSSLVSISGTSISGLSLNIKIVQAPHHWAYPVENVIESCCQGTSETGDMLCPSTCRALTYLQNGHSRG